MIYGRSYQKSGYWNFNIRYNRPARSTVATTTILTLLYSTLPRPSIHDLPARIRTKLPSGLSESGSANDLVGSSTRISTFVSVLEVNSVGIIVLLALLYLSVQSRNYG